MLSHIYSYASLLGNAAKFSLLISIYSACVYIYIFIHTYIYGSGVEREQQSINLVKLKYFDIYLIDSSLYFTLSLCDFLSDNINAMVTLRKNLHTFGRFALI